MILAAAHKNVTPFKARVEDGWPPKDGVKKNISMPTENPPPTRISSREDDSSQFKEKDDKTLK